MKQAVILSIQGRQRYQDQEPEIIELVTEGVMEFRGGGWDITYEESELTGLTGTRTVFCIEDGRVILTRTGAVQSRMVFSVGQEDRSLYDIGCGALMVAVRAERISSTVGENGGVLEVTYAISIEDETAGSIHYRIEVRPKP